MNRSATGIRACTALGLLALLPALGGSCSGGGGAAPGCGEGGSPCLPCAKPGCLSLVHGC